MCINSLIRNFIISLFRKTDFKIISRNSEFLRIRNWKMLSFMSFQRLDRPCANVRRTEDIFRGLLCGIYIDVRTKRNRSNRLFKTRSIMFSIIERVEFLMLRFYCVCKDVYLMPLKSSRFCLHPVEHRPWAVQS